MVQVTFHMTIQGVNGCMESLIYKIKEIQKSYFKNW